MYEKIDINTYTEKNEKMCTKENKENEENRAKQRKLKKSFYSDRLVQ